MRVRREDPGQELQSSREGKGEGRRTGQTPSPAGSLSKKVLSRQQVGAEVARGSRCCGSKVGAERRYAEGSGEEGRRAGPRDVRRA